MHTYTVMHHTTPRWGMSHTARAAMETAVEAPGGVYGIRSRQLHFRVHIIHRKPETQCLVQPLNLLIRGVVVTLR